MKRQSPVNLTSGPLRLKGRAHTSEQWLTAEEVARVTRVGLKTIYREVTRGHLRAAKVGGRRALRFRPEWVDAWMEGLAELVLVDSAP